MALPYQNDPRKLGLQGARLEGSVSIGDLTRLSLAVSRIRSPLQASIAFELDESRQQFAKGIASVSVEVICQRCLDPVVRDIQAKIALQIIWSEDQISNVAPNYEPWVVVDKTADLIPVVEDELLLALPIVNYHDIEDCTGDAYQQNHVREGVQAMPNNPFSVLQQLKK